MKLFFCCQKQIKAAPLLLLTLVLSRLICSFRKYLYLSPMERIFFLRPLSSLEIQIKLVKLLDSFWSQLSIQFWVLTQWQLFFYIFSSKFANRWAAEPSTGTLTLSNLQLEDFGLFQCLVQNKVSEHYVVSLLVVTGASHNSVIFRSRSKVMPNSTCVFAKQRLVRIHRILTNQIQGILYLANRLQDQAARLLPCFLLVTGFCCTDLSGYW